MLWFFSYFLLLSLAISPFNSALACLRITIQSPHSTSSFLFIVQYHFWYASIFHPNDVPQPFQSSTFDFSHNIWWLFNIRFCMYLWHMYGHYLKIIYHMFSNCHLEMFLWLETLLQNKMKSFNRVLRYCLLSYCSKRVICLLSYCCTTATGWKPICS
jgi:hypothetical protein